MEVEHGDGEDDSAHNSARAKVVLNNNHGQSLRPTIEENTAQ